VIDFHCHLDLFPDPEGMAAKAEAAGIYVLSVTTTPKAWRKTAELSAGKRHIRTALGLHPQLAHERSHELPLFEALISKTRYIGEIGLDGSPGYGKYADIQMRVFERVLAMAKDHGGRILTIHSRGATDEVLTALRQFQCANTSVLHWFSGTQRQLADAIAIGYWFSVGPAMFHSEKGRKLVALMPRDRILTETDGPFARSQNRPLEPADVQIAIERLAETWNLGQDDVLRVLKSNLKGLLAVPLTVPP
jgi:TatD DNase family protein